MWTNSKNERGSHGNMNHLRFKTSKTGILILKNTDIDIDAEFLIRDYNPDLLKTPQPLDVEDFTENYLGLKIHFDYLSNNGCIWGRMVFNHRMIPVYVPELGRAEYCPIEADTVVIDNSLLDSPDEFAFRSTMMHECGHDLYHSQIYRENDDQLSFFQLKPPQERIAATLCRSTDILGNGGSKQQQPLKSDRSWIEHHAKYFSAAVLMPKSMVKLICNEPGLRERLTGECCGFEEVFLAHHLSDVFNVSPASAKIRIKQLNLGFENVPNRHPHIFMRGYPSRFFGSAQ